MDNNQNITPNQAFEVIYQMTGELPLKRKEGQLLDGSLRALAQLLPVEQKETEVKNND